MKPGVLIILAVWFGILSLHPQDTNKPDTSQPQQQNQDEHDKVAIEKVARARCQIQTNCLKFTFQTNPAKRSKSVIFVFHDKEYLEKLKRINVLGCPKDFRLAWIDYVQTWERKVEAGATGKLKIFTEEALGTYSAAHGGSTKLIEEGIEKTKEPNNAEAWRQVEKCAIIYGTKSNNLLFRKESVDWETFLPMAQGAYKRALLLPDQFAK